MDSVIYTLGYSNRTLEEFVNILKINNIDALCDVRSSPYSKFSPQFNREAFKKKLNENGIAYVFLGEELGGRPGNISCYENEKADYGKMEKTEQFLNGLNRVGEALKKGYRPVLMCAEGDPLACHRAILVGKTLSSQGYKVIHILDKDKNETNEEMESRLVNSLNLQPDLFSDPKRSSLFQRAYEIQSKKIAYTKNGNGSKINGLEKNKVNLHTIGFTKTSAGEFFERIINAGVKKVIDVRLNNNSQLSGFAKKNDLKYFLATIAGIEYEHLPILAPSKDILDAYKKEKGSWEEYEKKFVRLMEERKVEEKVTPSDIDGGCFLCSEHEPEHCHRRLVAEYLSRKWQTKINTKHL
ncbi:MAG: DUF488 domain-containing protein [Nitrospina sp.]|jgi:uncharacterized protein (DUF488 family)|nr:DUF488 domain-containing protein [Nitrospina sp.]